MEARGDLHGKHEINLQQLLTRYGYERGRVLNPSFQEILILMRPLSRFIHVKHRSWLIGKLFFFFDLKCLFTRYLSRCRLLTFHDCYSGHTICTVLHIDFYSFFVYLQDKIPISVVVFSIFFSFDLYTL